MDYADLVDGAVYTMGEQEVIYCGGDLYTPEEWDDVEDVGVDDPSYFVDPERPHEILRHDADERETGYTVADLVPTGETLDV